MLCRIAALLAARANFSSFNFDLRMVNYRKETEAEEAMRRFLAALLAALTVFTLTGCGKTENPAEPVTPGQGDPVTFLQHVNLFHVTDKQNEQFEIVHKITL